MSLVLTSSGEKLEITAATVIPFTVHYADYIGATPMFTPRVVGGDTINGTRDLLAAPASGQSVIRTISVHNDSGGLDTVTIQLDDAAVNYTIVSVALPDDYTLYYDEDGWKVLDDTGSIQTTLVGNTTQHNILSLAHADTTTDDATRGSLIYGNTTPAWDELIIGGATQYLKSDGADVSWAAVDFDDLSGDCDLADLAGYVRGSFIRGGAADWEAHAAETNHFILVGDGTDIVSKAFDWDDISAGVGADMIHSHGSAGEGGEVPLTSLGSYVRGRMILGGVGDWTTLGAPAAGGYALVSWAGTHFVWDQTPAWTGAHAFNAGLSVAAGQDIVVGNASSIGIGGALERIEFYTAGHVCVLGAKFGVGTDDVDGQFTVEATLSDTIDDETVCHHLYRGHDDVNYWKTRLSATGQYWCLDRISGGTWYETVRIHRDGQFRVYADTAADYAGNFSNDGNNQNRHGLKVVGGADDASGTTNYLWAEDGDGDLVGIIRNNAGVFQLFDTSDRCYKKNIRPTEVKGLDIILGLPIIDHDWKKHDGPGRRAGLVAQDAQEVFPDMVNLVEEGEETLCIAPSRLIFVLVKAMQEQQAQIEALQAQLVRK